LITLVLADSHGIVREGIAAFCASRPDLKVIGQACDGPHAATAILTLKPDFAVIDLNLPLLSGLEVIRRIRMAKSETKLLVLSTSRDASAVRDAFQTGADGYLLKEGPARHLFDAISYVSDGGQYLTPLIQREVFEQAGESTDPLAQLSRREQEVFTFLVDGRRPKDIAKLLNISPKTVDTYRANVMRKLEVNGVAGLVRFAIQRNLQNGSSTA
jgi:DNA-binding NarL/FixJ family response regulator